MIKDIAIFGAGGFGREVACLIKRINDAGGDWNLIGFFDDTMSKGTKVSHYGIVLGGIADLNSWNQQISVVIAVGSPDSIFAIRNKIQNSNVSYPNIIDPSFTVVDPATFIIGCGNIIQTGCSVSCDFQMGDYNVLNGDVSIGHDVIIGDYNVIMPAVRVSGSVCIGQKNLIGVGSIILQKLKIGTNVRLGAGAVLLTKPKDGGLYLGNPAKMFKY